MLKVDFERYYFWNISNETTKVIILVLWEEKMIVYKKLYNEYAYNYISNFKDNLLFLSENSTVWWHDMIISLRFDSFECSLYNSMIQFLMWESQLAIYLFVIKYYMFQESATNMHGALNVNLFVLISWRLESHKATLYSSIDVFCMLSTVGLEHFFCWIANFGYSKLKCFFASHWGCLVCCIWAVFGALYLFVFIVGGHTLLPFWPKRGNFFI